MDRDGISAGSQYRTFGTLGATAAVTGLGPTATGPGQASTTAVTGPTSTTVVPGPGQTTAVTGQASTTQPSTAVPGSHLDGADFYGVFGAFAIIIVAILVIRLAFRRPTRPPGASTPPDHEPSVDQPPPPPGAPT